MPHLFWSQFHGFSVKFSPFDASDGHVLAVGTSQYFGVAGNGRLHVLHLHPSRGITERKSFLTQEGVFDVAFNELNEQQVAAGCADGSIRLFDAGAPDGFPVYTWLNAHGQEVSHLSWSGVDKGLLASTGWDGAVKVWTPGAPDPVLTLLGHDGAVYGAEWHPRHRRLLASVSADRCICLWDVAAAGARPQISILASPQELLCCDWNKYRDHELVAGGCDGVVRVWDTRNTRHPVHHLQGHRLPVRRVKCSPHDGNVIASAACDPSVVFWNLAPVGTLSSSGAGAGAGAGGGGAGGAAGPTDGVPANLTSRCTHHREFVYGFDFALFEPGVVATTGWDQSVVAWDASRGCPPRVPPVPLHMRMTAPPPAAVAAAAAAPTTPGSTAGRHASSSIANR